MLMNYYSAVLLITEMTLGGPEVGDYEGMWRRVVW